MKHEARRSMTRMMISSRASKTSRTPKQPCRHSKLEMDEIEKLQAMLRSRQSPTWAAMEKRVEKRIQALMEKLFPGDKENDDDSE